MNHISELDSNFKVETKIEESDLRFYDVKEAPFGIYGVFFENGKFRRLPEKVAQTVSRGVNGLHAKAAGGRVRFRTDSPYVAIHAKMPKIYRMSHFSLTGSSGFDLYVDGEFHGTFVPPYDMEEGYESIQQFKTKKMREITINLPLYSVVSELYIGLSDEAEVAAPTPYEIEKPIVYYGSSITQGGCASRPGNAYESILSRRLNADHVNLGFSGNAKGEKEMAEYISTLSMSAFVLDYDYNAPSVEHLRNTHEPFFRIVRDANPDLPILILSRPSYRQTAVVKERLEVIRTTYENALARGDRNVYLIDGKTLMAMAGNDGTVDLAHPTDFGFFSMAKAVGDVLESILKK